MMSHRVVHQATAFGLAAVFTFSILGSIDLLAARHGEAGATAAAKAAAQVAQTTATPATRSAGS